MPLSRRTLLTAAGAALLAPYDDGRPVPIAVTTRRKFNTRQQAVALVAADGESISGDSQSNFLGNGVWARRGWAKAAALGFDDPGFLPIATWLTDFGGTGFYTRMADLGINGMLPAAGSITLDNLPANGVWAVVTSDTHAAGSISSTADPNVIGVSSGEEPSSVAHYDSIVTANDAWLDNAGDGPGRGPLYNFADNLLNGDIENTYFPADMVDAHASVGRNQWTTCDQYWFAGMDDNAGGSVGKLFFRLYQGVEGTPAAAQVGRGSHYGSMMDVIRAAMTSGNRHPAGVWIENGAPYTETTSHAITPAQMTWAIFSTLVHGARGIYYFNHTFKTGDPLAGSNNFASDGYGGPGVTGTGIYAAAKSINTLAMSMASVLNSPFDGYFVYPGFAYAGGAEAPQIETAGFVTAVTSTNARTKFGGVEASCRWQPTERRHYVLACTREAEAAANIPMTVRMVDQGQTQAVSLTGGSTLTVQRGGAIPGGFCEFSHTFATGADYAAWRIQ